MTRARTRQLLVELQRFLEPEAQGDAAAVDAAAAEACAAALLLAASAREAKAHAAAAANRLRGLDPKKRAQAEARARQLLAATTQEGDRAAREGFLEAVLASGGTP